MTVTNREDVPAFHLHSTTTRPLRHLFPALAADLRSADVWLRAGPETSPRATWLDLELHRHAAQSLYIALVRSSLHLTRSAHIALASLCSWNGPFTGGSIHLLLEIRQVSARSIRQCASTRFPPISFTA